MPLLSFFARCPEGRSGSAGGRVAQGERVLRPQGPHCRVTGTEARHGRRAGNCEKIRRGGVG